jgi:hypothetical protein
MLRSQLLAASLVFGGVAIGLRTGNRVMLGPTIIREDPCAETAYRKGARQGTPGYAQAGL